MPTATKTTNTKTKPATGKTPLMEIFERQIAEELAAKKATQGGLDDVHEVDHDEPESLEEALTAGPVTDADVDHEATQGGPNVTQGAPEGGPNGNGAARPAADPDDASLHASANGEVVWTAWARKRQEPEDPSDRFALPVILNVQVRLVARARDYELEQKHHDDGSWKRLSGGYSPDAAVFGLAFFGLDVMSEDLAKVSRLPKLRPAEAQRRERHEAYLKSQQLGGHERST